MDFSLRRADRTDLDSVMVLEESGFPPGIVESRATFVKRIAVFPEGFLLAETVEGSAVGYCCCEVWNGWDRTDPTRFELGHDLSFWLDRSGDILYVASMTVLPSGVRTGGRRHRPAAGDQTSLKG